MRNDVGEQLPEISVKDAYRRMSYRESRDKNGNLTYLSQKEGLELIQDEMIVDIFDGKLKSLKECLM